MAGPATLPPARAPRDPPQPPRRTDAPRKPAAACAARPSAPFLSPGLRSLAALSCPEPGYHSSSDEDDCGTGGGNGGGMCCRLRGGGSLDLRARLCGHAHRRQPGSPIGRPGSGVLGQSKGAMESGGGRAKGKGKGESGAGKGLGAGAWEGRVTRGGRNRRQPKRSRSGSGRAWAGRSGPGYGGMIVGVALDVGVLNFVLFLLRRYLSASFTLEGKEVCLSSMRSLKP